jgi:hypothetical protein
MPWRDTGEGFEEEIEPLLLHQAAHRDDQRRSMPDRV